jgi:hypothetical protein
MTEKEFEELKAKQKEYDDSIAAAEDRLAKAEWRGGATRMQADADAEQIRMLQNMWLNGDNAAQQLAFDTARQLQYDAAVAQAARSRAEYQQATGDINVERARLAALRGKPIRPNWPTTFDPVDPAKLQPVPPALPPVERPKDTGANPFAKPRR